VVCSDFPSLRDFVRENVIGETVASLDALPGTITSLGNRLDTLRTNALTCYQEKLRFEPHFEKFFSELTGSGR
jgi:hypothetical protein